MKTNINQERDFKASEYFVVVGLIVLCIFLTIISKGVFLSGTNVTNVLLQTTINSIVAIGMTVVILTGGIDLSVGSIVGLTGIFSGMLFQKMGFADTLLNAILCIVGGICIGLACGCINGLLISKAKLPAFIATLGTMSIARGFALAITGGRPITSVPFLTKFIGNGQIGFIKMPIIIMIVAYAIAWWMLRHTRLGRNIYATGGNIESARLSGINVNKTLLATYTISGFTAALSGIIYIGRMATAQTTAGEGYEMDAIAAVVIGGASMTGGQGRILGTLIGALFITVIKNGLSLLNVNTHIQQIVTGLVIVFAVMSDTLRKQNN